MSDNRYQQAEWIEWSGLPLALNKARSGAWPLFKKLTELDCRRNARPGTVEITLTELAERTGLTPDAVTKLSEALRKKKVLRCYLPEHPDEDALFEIRTPLPTPLAAEDVARRAADPTLRDATHFRYARAEEDPPALLQKVQQIVDLYFNHLSQKMNSFVLEQIEIAARRFPLESIRHTIERAARHEMRTMGWVLKELIRDEGKIHKRDRLAGDKGRA